MRRRFVSWTARPPQHGPVFYGMLAYGYARAGRTNEARAMIETLRAQSGGRIPATGALAATLEELGDHEAAVALLGEAIARHDPWLTNFTRAERYDRLRKDRRVAAMMARLETR